MSGRRLGHEAAKLRAEGTDTLLIQPSRDDLETMGLNMMARHRRVEVLERARRTTALGLRELRGTDQVMPPRTRKARRPAPAVTRGRSAGAGGARVAKAA
jgi:NTE family protein